MANTKKLGATKKAKAPAKRVSAQQKRIDAAGWRGKVAVWSQTFIGKLTFSAARAFIGVFIGAESQLFNLLAQIVNKQAEFGALRSLVIALGAAAVTAALRAVQHYLFDKPIQA